LASGCENVLAAARESINVAFAAEVAEKSGAAFPLSGIAAGAFACARATLTLPSSKNANAKYFFIVLPSEG
jgi:hypothetical protein